MIGTAGRQSASGAINDLSREFGQTSRGSGFGDLFLLAGVYGRAVSPAARCTAMACTR